MEWRAIGGEGVVEMGYGGDVPRAASHRARDEAVDVVNQVMDDDLYEFLREAGDWGRTKGGYFFATPPEELLDLGLASIPQPDGQQFGRWARQENESCWKQRNIWLWYLPVSEDVGVFTSDMVGVEPMECVVENEEISHDVTQSNTRSLNVGTFRLQN